MPALFKGYFMMGGSQVQVTVADAKKIQAAFDHPEEHKDLIVRIGGPPAPASPFFRPPSPPSSLPESHK